MFIWVLIVHHTSSLGFYSYEPMIKTLTLVSHFYVNYRIHLFITLFCVQHVSQCILSIDTVGVNNCVKFSSKFATSHNNYL